MIASVSSYAVLLSLTAQQSQTTVSQGGQVVASVTTTSVSVSTDIVSLSSQAQALLGQGNAVASPYEKFMPTRDGFSSAALAAAVTDPGAESFSAGKTFAQVATAARAELDKEYTAMKASGKPFDYNSMEGKDWYSLFGNLDRRALAAVRANEGGQFTKQEQDIASSIMSQQQGLAMGLYSGPTRLEGSFVDKFADDEPARDRANAAWLDGVSNDEKATIPWAMARAGAQTALKSELDIPNAGGSVDFSKFESENPLVKLIAAAMDTMRQGGARMQNKGMVETADDLKKQPWFEGFADQLAPAIAQTKSMYQGPAGDD
jgi:hypothetical protein